MIQPAGQSADFETDDDGFGIWSKAQYDHRELGERRNEYHGLVNDGLDPIEAAELAGVEPNYGPRRKKASYVPSPASIAAGCLRVQEAWSPRERRSRITGPSDQLSVQVVTAGDLAEAVGR